MADEKMGFMEMMERAPIALAMFAVATLIFVQITTILVNMWFPDIRVIKVGWAMQLVFFFIGAIALINVASMLGFTSVTKAARENELMARKSIMRWGIIVAILTFAIGVALPAIAKDTLFAIMPLQTDLTLEALTLQMVR